MSGSMDPTEIEKLFARANDGDLPVESDVVGGPPSRRARWLRTVDFTRPTKFSADQERRIRRALDTFTERAAQRLAAEHRTTIEMEVIDLGQLTWNDAFAQVPDGSVMITMDTGPHEARMLLTCELPVVLVALERMLGGNPETASRERELTDIDLMVVQRLFTTIVESLSSVWFDIAEMTLQIAAVDTQVETIQVASGAEPTLALTMEAHVDGVGATMSLLVPYASIAPVASSFSRRDEDVATRDPRSVDAVRHELTLVDVSLRAEVADTMLSLDEVLALQPGDVVALDANAGAEVTLFADRTPVHRGRAGRSGKHRAVQITTPVEPAP
jgi:flagellar motor switch protein FliM